MNKQFLLAISAVLLFSTMSWAQESVNESEGDPTQQFEGFNLQGYTDGGTKSWDVNGETADILGDEIKLTNIEANAYGDEPIRLTAKEGTVNRESGHMHLENDVVITSKDGTQLKTDSLDWDRNNDLVTTDDYVTITGEKVEANGTGITAHPNLKTAQLNEDVTARIDADLEKASQRLTITCDGPMEMNQSKQFAVFNDNVVAIQEGRKLLADRMEVYFNPEDNQIREIICLGNVMVQQGENRSFSEKAIFKPQEQRVIFTGRPKLILFTEGQNGIASFGD